MINGQWFMAHGSRMAGGLAGAPSQGARSHPWAMSHEALTIKIIDWLMNSYSIIYYRYYVLGGLQFELNSKQFGKTMIQAIPSNSTFHNKFTVKMSPKMPKTFEFEFQFEFPLPRDPPSKLLIQRPIISSNRKLGPQSLGIQNHVPMVIWASIDERSYCVPSTIIPSTWIEHQSRWLSAFQLLRHDSSHNWMDTHAWVAL